MIRIRFKIDFMHNTEFNCTVLTLNIVALLLLLLCAGAWACWSCRPWPTTTGCRSWGPSTSLWWCTGAWGAPWPLPWSSWWIPTWCPTPTCSSPPPSPWFTGLSSFRSFLTSIFFNHKEIKSPLHWNGNVIFFKLNNLIDSEGGTSIVLFYFFNK